MSEANEMIDGRIDRYGDERGSFFSPAGTPFEERSLPPDTDRNDLHEYQILKSLPVFQGTVVAWFGFKGGAVQYQVDWNQIAESEGVSIHFITSYRGGQINWLVENGWLMRLRSPGSSRYLNT